LTKISVKDLNFVKGKGLIPVVVQDCKTRKVLMVGYANITALEKTLSSGYVHYWSRSRGRLWMKGESSGNVQKVREVLVDCDYDTLLFIVEQKGAACHTGEESCFHNRLEEFCQLNRN
jgi:phosphoribosyl-AMP cyclohydrolase